MSLLIRRVANGDHESKIHDIMHSRIHLAWTLAVDAGEIAVNEPWNDMETD